jgi:hypothetical protein
MTGIAYGLGTPTSYIGQTFPATSPFGGYAFGAQAVGPQAQHFGQQLPQQQVLQQLLQIVPQQLQQLLHILPQQLSQLQNVQQQVHHLQQLLQILPQQLHQLQQLVQNLPHHQPFYAAPQPFGTIQSPNVGAFGAGPSQPPVGPWGHGVPIGYPQTAGILPQNFGFGAQPGQLM